MTIRSSRASEPASSSRSRFKFASGAVTGERPAQNTTVANVKTKPIGTRHTAARVIIDLIADANGQLAGQACKYMTVF